MVLPHGRVTISSQTMTCSIPEALMSQYSCELWRSSVGLSGDGDMRDACPYGCRASWTGGPVVAVTSLSLPPGHRHDGKRGDKQELLALVDYNSQGDTSCADRQSNRGEWT